MHRHRDRIVISRIPLTSPEYIPFLREVNRMRLPIHIHPSLPMDRHPAPYKLGASNRFSFRNNHTATKMVFDGGL